MRSRKHQIILQGIVLCLRWSYTCAWKSSPGPFHHLTETTRIKFQADFSLLQNLYIQTYILHIVFISWKHQPLPRAETSDIQRTIWDYLPQSCNAVNLKGIKTLHMKHYFFLLSSSPWQHWQVLFLFMTPNINDLLLYLCLIFFTG